jgi:hypothetical protein
MPIMLDDNGDNNRPDAEFDATTSDDDDDRTLGATPPADTDEDRHTSVAAMSIEPVANSQSRGEATDSVSSGRSKEWFSRSLLRIDSAIGLPLR